MKYPKLYKAIVLKKYKMFYVDVKLEDGSIVTAYTRNKGGFKKEMGIGRVLYVSKSDNQNRKTQYSVELIEYENNLSGVDTHLSNKLLKEFFLKDNFLNLIYIKSEIVFDDSRLDLQLEHNGKTVYAEVKTILTYENQTALFPESITERGQKHLQLLTKLSKKYEVYLFYVIQVNNAQNFRIRKEIDPAYYEYMQKAIKAGVKIIGLQTKITKKEIIIDKIIEMI